MHLIIILLSFLLLFPSSPTQPLLPKHLTYFCILVNGPLCVTGVSCMREDSFKLTIPMRNVNSSSWRDEASRIYSILKLEQWWILCCITLKQVATAPRNPWVLCLEDDFRALIPRLQFFCSIFPLFHSVPRVLERVTGVQFMFYSSLLIEQVTKQKSPAHHIWNRELGMLFTTLASLPRFYQCNWDYHPQREKVYLLFGSWLVDLVAFQAHRCSHISEQSRLPHRGSRWDPFQRTHPQI